MDNTGGLWESAWLKIECLHYDPSQGSGQALRYAGKVGTGYGRSTLGERRSPGGIATSQSARTASISHIRPASAPPHNLRILFYINSLA